MVVAIAVFDFHLPGCRGLKEKRAFLRPLKTRLRGDFEISAAEVAHQDLLQRADPRGRRGRAGPRGARAAPRRGSPLRRGLRGGERGRDRERAARVPGLTGTSARREAPSAPNGRLTQVTAWQKQRRSAAAGPAPEAGRRRRARGAGAPPQRGAARPGDRLRDDHGRRHGRRPALGARLRLRLRRRRSSSRRRSTP